MIRKVIALLLLISNVMCLSSCYDADEIEDISYVVAIGIDRGISDKWRLTLQFSTMKEGGGKDGNSVGNQAKTGYTYISIDAPSFFTGIDMLNTSMQRKLNFMHALIIVFSEELAKSGLVGEFIAPLNRFRQIRGTANIVVVKGTALDFIKENQPSIGELVSKNFEIQMHESENTGFFPIVTLENFYEGLKSGCHQPIATLAAVNSLENFADTGQPWGDQFKTGGNYYAGELPRQGENKIELFGTAVFDGDTMVGELNGEETRHLLMARGEFERGFFTVQDQQKPETIVALDVKRAKPTEVDVKLIETRPAISLKIFLEADILAVQSGIDYEQPELKEALEKSFAQSVADGTAKVIEKCMALNTDVFEFGGYAAKKFLTISEWENYDWNSRFKESEVTIEVKFVIKRTGTQLKSSPIMD